MLRAYFLSRFLRLLFLWTCIFIAAIFVNGAVGAFSTVQIASAINTEKLSEFADVKLLVALTLGSMLVLFLHWVMKRSITLDEQEEHWGESTVDAVMDEISAASTHYACVLIVANAYHALLVGTFHWSNSLTVGLFAIAIAVYTFDARANYPRFTEPVAGEFEAKIATPAADTEFEEGASTEFKGSVYKRPPKGYKAWLVRRWEEDASAFYPVKELTFDEGRSPTITFNVVAEVWGDAGNYRYFELWLVGPQGSAVFDAWVNGNRRFVGLQGVNFDQRFLYPGLEQRTSDMVAIFRSRRVRIKDKPSSAIPQNVALAKGGVTETCAATPH